MLSEAQLSRELKNRDGVRRVLILTLSVHLTISAAKLIMGYQGNIVSLQADGLHSLFDALSNIIGLVALGVALRPPDPEHPYGHRKVEVVASLAIGFMLLLALLEVGRGLWNAFTGDIAPQIGPLAFFVQSVAIVASLGISRYEIYKAKVYDSMLLEADANHTLSDALAGLSVILGMTLVTLGVAPGDLLAALVVMAFIGVAAFRVLKNVTDVLVDAALLDANEIRDVVEAFDEVLSCHYVRSRGMRGAVHLDLHVTMPPEISLSEAGDVMVRVKDRLREHFPELTDIVMQVEPHKPAHYEDVPEHLL